MSTSHSGSSGRPGGSAPLHEALDKNRQVAEEVKEAADELAVVHAVLDSHLPGDAGAEDVARAVAHTGEIEKRLTESGKILDEVNETLERATQAPSSPA
jgi:hypothetical protein